MAELKKYEWLIRLGKTALVILVSLGTLFLIAKIFPLPKNQGLAYVAHPLYALGGNLLAGIVYFILSSTRRFPDNWLFWICVGGSGLLSLVIFTMA
ncbi:MAG: hypothetical protein R3D00_09575 [Bacteroidia bacterium]